TLLSQRSPDLERWAKHHQAKYLKEHLCTILRGVGRRVVGWGDLDHVPTNEIKAAHASDEFQRLSCGQPANLRRSGSRCKSRIQAIDVKGKVSRAIADHF